MLDKYITILYIKYMSLYSDHSWNMLECFKVTARYVSILLMYWYQAQHGFHCTRSSHSQSILCLSFTSGSAKHSRTPFRGARTFWRFECWFGARKQPSHSHLDEDESMGPGGFDARWRTAYMCIDVCVCGWLSYTSFCGRWHQVCFVTFLIFFARWVKTGFNLKKQFEWFEQMLEVQSLELFGHEIQ